VMWRLLFSWFMLIPVVFHSLVTGYSLEFPGDGMKNRLRALRALLHERGLMLSRLMGRPVAFRVLSHGKYVEEVDMYE